uniref:Str_synth domain-containing protein n=1 Tax=Panagrellus redivivus TaxID=6233 RepID=A0A7E4UXQ0_PANRE
MPSLWPSRDFVAFLTVAIAFSALYFMRPNVKVDPEIYQLPSPPKLVGDFEPNQRLVNAQYLVHGAVKGPESLHIEGDRIYTGTADGKIAKIDHGLLSSFYVFHELPEGTKCDASYDSEVVCGRPLGIRNFDDSRLIVADAYYGIYLFNKLNGESVQLVSKEATAIDGNPCTFFNDVEVQDDTTIFFSCSSTKYERRQALVAFLEQASDGRVYKYTTITKKLEVIQNGLRFANGIQLTDNKTALLVSETGMARIWKLPLKANSKPIIFIDNLPGLPDNIRSTSRGTYLVGLAGHRSDGKFSAFDYLGDKPWVRKLLLESVPDFILTKLMLLVQPHYGFIIEFDAEGKIVQTYQDPLGRSVGYVSEVVEAGGFLFIGSFKDSFIAKVPKKSH